jgi:hypothetical protein
MEASQALRVRLNYRYLNEFETDGLVRERLESRNSNLAANVEGDEKR